MDGTPIEVSSAGPDRLVALAPVFGRAFVDEPMMCWPTGIRHESPDEERADGFTTLFSYFLEEALPSGVVWEADSAKGAAVWIPPGLFELWDRHPWNQPRIHARTVDKGTRYDRFWRWVDAHTPDEPLWQLDSIAVDPPAQGRGYGAALIRAGLARARADGIGAYLSTGTERNVDIYGRFGFRVVSESDAPGEGGPHIWFMRWDPPRGDSG